MLSKVEETLTEEDSNGVKKETTRNIPVLYMRGDTMIGLSPLKSADGGGDGETLISLPI
jgi:hypothetical protein